MRLAFTVLALCFAAGPAVAADHVRVILDTSQSMRVNDEPRLAPLATLLLRDLARPASADSFHVITFHDTVKWAGPSAPLPTEIGRRIVADSGQRASFVATIGGLRYDSNWTHFYPGLLAAINDLEATPGGVADRRVIVVVTDGVPSPSSTAEAELQVIQRDLVPRMVTAGIRVYFLAFGPEAVVNKSFFERIVEGPRGNIGQIFADTTGKDLLGHMIEIFARSFGYTSEPPVVAGPAEKLKLEGDRKSGAAAVVLFWKSPHSPRLRLSPAPTSMGGPQVASERGASYALQWVLTPRAEPYTLGPEASSATVAILRPITLRIEIRPKPPATSVTSAVAQSPFPVRVVVSPATGPRGDPGPVDLAFQVHGPRKDRGYEWSEKEAGAGTVGQSGPDGRIFDITPTFPRDPKPGQASYTGHLEVIAQRRDAIVGSLSGEHAHGMTVFPFVSLVPNPRLASVAVDGHVRALTSFERGCATFRLELASNSLPHPERPTYSVRAVIDPGVRRDPRLAGATFTLDGAPLEFEAIPRAAPAAWYIGRRLDREGLLGAHELCVQAGRPRRSDPSNAADATLHLTLFEIPYDTSRVIAPFVGRVVLAPPGWIDVWGSIAGLLGALLVCAALLWYARDRPRLPADLHFAAGDDGGPMSTEPLGPGSALARLCGLVAEAPVVVAGRLLGRVRPVDRELYAFRPARGVVATGATGLPLVSVAVHQTFRVRQGDRESLLRLEYR